MEGMVEKVKQNLKKLSKRRKLMKKIKSIAVIMLLAAMTICMFPTMTKAATKPKGPQNQTVFYYPKDKDRNKYYVSIKNLGDVGWRDSKGEYHNLEYSNVKVSNKKVISNLDLNLSFIEFNTKKAGTTTISFRARVAENTYYNYLFKVKINKYQCPAKSFKINGKQHINKMKNGNAELYNIKPGKEKIDFKMNKNWVVKSIKYKYYKADSSSITGERLVTKKLKNKKKFTQKMNIVSYLEIKCKNKKTKVYSTIQLVVK